MFVQITFRLNLMNFYVLGSSCVKGSFWVKKGRTYACWKKNCDGEVSLSDWRENSFMSRESFYELFNKLRPYLTKQKQDFETLFQ